MTQQTEQTTLPATQEERPASALQIIKHDVVDVISKRIEQLVGSGDLEMPENYSPQNALMSFWLTLQETEDKNHRPAIEVCTKNSIANAAMDMVIQGLTTSKDQGYLIVYGSKLVFQRSYFGTAAVLKRIMGAQDVDTDIATELVFEGDDFEYAVQGGKKSVTKHAQRFENIDKDRILGGYCIISDRSTGEVIHTEVMTIDQIRKAWSMGNQGGTGDLHKDFTDEACKRTLINRACKVLINSSDDSYLKKAVQRQEVLATETAMEAEMEEKANSEGLGVDVFDEDGERVGTLDCVEDARVEDAGVEDPEHAAWLKEHEGAEGGPGF